VAHESVYRFYAGLVPGRRVLDAACGTGYGSHLLASANAADVVGVDINRRRIAYANRHFQLANLSFSIGDCHDLQLPPGSRVVIVSSNTLEHLARPVEFLREAHRVLAPAGPLAITVPPVLSEADLRVHSRNPFHSSPLSIRAWADLFSSQGWAFDFFGHYSSVPVDLGSPHPSTVSVSDFSFEQCSVADAYVRPPLSATYLLRRASASGSDPTAVGVNPT
jgi:SAM-dependent methyltransferase